jgi:hypothetical protein
VVLIGSCPTETAGTAPLGKLANLFTPAVKLRTPFPVATFQYYSKEWPGMIMYIIWITLEKLVYKDVEWKPISVSEKHIVAFQVRFVFHTVHDNTVPTYALKEFFKHVTIVQQISISVKKKPDRKQGFL